MARVRGLADEMWAAAPRPQGELGDEHHPRLGVHPARRRAALQLAQRALPQLHRHERSQPAASDGTGTASATFALIATTHINFGG